MLSYNLQIVPAENTRNLFAQSETETQQQDQQKQPEREESLKLTPQNFPSLEDRRHLNQGNSSDSSNALTTKSDELIVMENEAQTSESLCVNIFSDYKVDWGSVNVEQIGITTELESLKSASFEAEKSTMIQEEIEKEVESEGQI